MISPTGSTSTPSSSFINPPSSYGTLFSSGIASRTASTVFSHPTGGPFSYGILPITESSNDFSTSQSYFANNTVGVGSSNPFNFLIGGSNASLNAPLSFRGNPPTAGIGSSIPSRNMMAGAFPPLL